MKKIIQNPIFLIAMIMILVVSIVLKDSLTNQVYAVTVKVDGKTHQVESQSDDVESLMIENNIQVSDHDKMNVNKEEPLADGMIIEVERAKQVTIKRGDELISLFTHADKISDVLAEAGISEGDFALTFPELDSSIVDGEVIKVFDEIQQIEEPSRYEVSIEPVTEYVEDPYLEKGVEEVRQQGEPGIISFEFVPGDENFDINAGEIIKEPVDEIIAQGTYVEPAVEEPTSYETSNYASSYESYDTSTNYESSEESSTAPSGNTMIFEATAYNLIGTTASGVPSGPGYVAVDPNVIPLGTRLYIESTDGWPDYGYAIAADTGSAIKGHIIDLFYYDYDTCIQFGRRNIKVTILD